uniref:Leucine rich immune protein (Coil-less) n=1 Tax=Anopheles atroparvus TaxID=41427 RepID=A0A182J573_ANOAO
MEVLEIPIDLEYGDFSRGKIKYLVVPPSETAYPLRYLDLQLNIMGDIRNLSTLVNLETLILSRNRLSSITKQVFQRMTNLTTLDISMNRILEISFSMLPPRLEIVLVHLNGLHSVDFSDANLPALEVLTLSYGFLSDLNTTALLAAAPKLKEIMLLHNEFGLEKEMNISAALKAAGISHDDGFGVEETDELEYESYGVFNRNENSIYQDRMAQFWEHTFAWLLAIGNAIVLREAGFRNA